MPHEKLEALRNLLAEATANVVTALALIESDEKAHSPARDSMIAGLTRISVQLARFHMDVRLLQIEGN